MKQQVIFTYASDLDAATLSRRMSRLQESDGQFNSALLRDSLKRAECIEVVNVEFCDGVLDRWGAKLAEEFMLKRSETHSDRWQLGTGNKTNIGLAKMFLRYAAEMQRGQLSL